MKELRPLRLQNTKDKLKLIPLRSAYWSLKALIFILMILGWIFNGLGTLCHITVFLFPIGMLLNIIGGIFSAIESSLQAAVIPLGKMIDNIKKDIGQRDETIKQKSKELRALIKRYHGITNQSLLKHRQQATQANT